MKKCFAAAFLVLFLWGCAAGNAPEAAPETVEPTRPIPVTAPTEPPQTEPAETEPPDPVAALLEQMTLEEKIGQLFFARCPTGDGVNQLRQYHLGGYVLFGQDVQGQTPDSLRQTIREYQQASSVPMLIAVDEEGGTVCRISTNPAFRSSPFRSPRELYQLGGMEEVLDTESEKAAMMWDLGINVLLGPVCDVSVTPGAFMYQRSLGESPDITGEFAAGTVERLSAFGVGSVLKHFPGYGDNRDTHTDIAVDSRPLDILEQVDLLPFAAGIRAGSGAIMMSHNIVEAMDPEYPASLSGRVHSYLRAQMGFTGVILTDDLDMGAITEQYGPGEAAVLAILAGNSMICTGSYPEQYEAVREAVESGRIPAEMIDSAVTYILRWKQQLGLIE